MKYLLDTHTFLWALQDSSFITNDIKNIIIDEHNDIYISTISLWEISVKSRKHHSIFPYDVKQLINYAIQAGYIFLSLSIDNIICFNNFDFGTHKDPFDQMLISQSISSNIKIITHDEAIHKIIPQNTVFF